MRRCSPRAGSSTRRGPKIPAGRLRSLRTAVRRPSLPAWSGSVLSPPAASRRDLTASVKAEVTRGAFPAGSAWSLPQFSWCRGCPDRRDAVRRRGAENLVEAHEVVLELASQVSQVLTPLEVCEQLVEEKGVRLHARYSAAEGSEIVQLAESASEGCLAALVRPRDDDQTLGILQREIVGDYGR